MACVGVEELKNIHVCAKELSEVDIETIYSIAQADDAFTTQDREAPKLKKDYVPNFCQIALRICFRSYILKSLR